MRGYCKALLCALMRLCVAVRAGSRIRRCGQRSERIIVVVRLTLTGRQEHKPWMPSCVVRARQDSLRLIYHMATTVVAEAAKQCEPGSGGGDLRTPL